MVVIGVLLVVFGLAVLSDPFDSGDVVIYGLPWIAVGLALVSVGWWRLTRYR